MSDTGPNHIAICATIIYPLKAPKVVSNIDYANTFIIHPSFTDTKKALEIADMTRKQMANELASPPGQINYTNVVNNTERYLPLLLRVIRSIDQSVKAVRLTRKMEFKWVSQLCNKEVAEKDYLTYEVFIYEIAMTIGARALSQVNVAHSHVRESGTGFTEASTMLRQAAGSFRTLAQEHLPRWKDNGDATRFAETIDGAAIALADLCIAQAQMMAVGKSISQNKGPPSLMVKLCQGVITNLEKCV